MNILQIIPNKGWGGGEKVVHELSLSLANQGDNVVTIIPDCPIVEGHFSNSQARYIKLDFGGPLGIGSLFRLVKIIKDNDIEIVHAHIFKHAAAALLARSLFGLRVKVVMTRHICKPGKNKLHYPALYKNLDNLIFVSHYSKETFLSSSPAIDEAKIRVIHNSIITGNSAVSFSDSESGRAVTKIQKEQPSKVRIGYAGGLSYPKGIDLAICALGELKDQGIDNFHLFIAGRGSDVFVGKLHKLIEVKNLSDNVSFIGFIDDAIGFYSVVDFVIAPSRIAEAGSLTVLEALSAGRAIIATESSSNECIDDGIEGYVTPRDDQKSLEIKVAKLIQDRELRIKMGCSAKLRFDRDFIYTKYLAKYRELYKSLL